MLCSVLWKKKKKVSLTPSPPPPLTPPPWPWLQLLRSGQYYRVALDIEIPENQLNLDSGVFMVNLTFYSTQNRFIATSARPVSPSPSPSPSPSKASECFIATSARPVSYLSECFIATSARPVSYLSKASDLPQ